MKNNTLVCNYVVSNNNTCICQFCGVSYETRPINTINMACSAFNNNKSQTFTKFISLHKRSTNNVESFMNAMNLS